MSGKTHGILEDLAAEIGYTATNSLVDWLGGTRLWIPMEVSEDHVITRVIGVPAMRRLVRLYEGMVDNERLLEVPVGNERDINRRDRMIAVLLSQGYGSKSVGVIAGMSESHVQKVRQRVEDMGLLPVILRQAGLKKTIR